MQTLTKFDKVVIEDYYHMTTMVKNVNWIKQTHLLLIFPLILRPLFVHLPLHQKFLISFLYLHNMNYTSSLCVLVCTQMPPIIPLLTLVLDWTWYEKSTP